MLQQTSAETNFDKLEDLQEKLWQTTHLLEALVHHVMDMDFTRDGARDPSMDHMDALLRLARDTAFANSEMCDSIVGLSKGWREIANESRASALR